MKVNAKAVENLKKEAGNYYSIITLKTDSNIMPSIHINVRGYIQDQQPKNKKTAPENSPITRPKRHGVHPAPQPE